MEEELPFADTESSPSLSYKRRSGVCVTTTDWKTEHLTNFTRT